MIVTCNYCGIKCEKQAGHVNRANKIGAPIYCSKKCAGIARRDGKTVEQKKKEKSEYDRQYRAKNIERLTQQRAEYFKKDYAANPEKYKKERERRYPEHLKYLQKPEYKEYKKGYDQQHRAEKLYGDFAEAAIALHQLRQIVDNRQAKKDQELSNKSQKRKRNATKNIKRKELESCVVGIHQPS